MDTQEAVETPAEPTVETESAPVETPAEGKQTTDSSPTQEVSEPPKKTSESVPYERFKEVNDRLNDPIYIAQKASEMGLVQQNQSTSTGELSELDPDVVPAVRKEIQQEIEAVKVKEFLAKHGEELQSNPLLDDRTKGIIARSRSAGKYIYQEDALSQARKELDEFAKPKTEEAVNKAVKETNDLAKEKLMYSAVGDNKANPKVDPNTLSSEEFKKFHNLEYSE
jgi:hypothetical protein